MSRLNPAASTERIAWIGRAPPGVSAHPLEGVATLEAAVSLRPLPSVLVYDPPAGMALEDQLHGLSSSALRPLTVLLAIDSAEPELLARLAAAGAFCGLLRDSSGPARDTVLQVALEHVRRGRREPDPSRPEGDRGLMTRAGYECRTLEEAEALAGVLARCCPEPLRREGGILELLVNAVEHGNLEITAERKRALLAEGRWYAEVQARLLDPRFSGRRVRVGFERGPDQAITLTVQDEGPGFDWREVLASELAGNQTRHGRGIALARLMSFDELCWDDQGRRAVARILP